MLPLADVRVVAVEQFGAGPWGTLQLADLGAEVIKIEDPASRGDVGRYVPPFQEGEDSLFFETFNRNKKSVSLDLRHPDARAVFEDLVRASDVVYSNLRGDQPAKLRLMYDDLKHVNPRIVCCSLSGFGMTGPRAREGGYDYMMQGLAGWMSLTGDPDGPPTKSGLSLVDLSGGYVSAIAVLAGLWRARRDGVGCDCDVSLFETALARALLRRHVGGVAWLRPAAAAQLGASVDRAVPELRDRRRLDRRLVPEGEVLDAALRRRRPARPGRGVPDLRRPRRRAARSSSRSSRRSSAGGRAPSWLAVLAAAGVPSAPVNTVEEALEETRLIEYEHPALGTVRTVASPLRLSDAEVAVRPAPARGEHTEQVLVELCGYEPERVSELAAAGVFG